MCDLIGLCCDSASKAIPLLNSFAEHSIRNPHGWGIAYYRGSEAILRKKPESALASKEFFRTMDEAESEIIISHIRNASCGDKHERNCHPFKHDFRGRQWIFAHNGHVDGITIHPRSGGETDSETVFHMLLDSIDRANDPYSGIIGGLECLFNEYEHGRAVKLNFLLSDGENMYAFSHHQEKPMFTSGKQAESGESMVISTQLLDGMNWAKLPEDRLLVACRGKLLKMSGKI